MFFRGEVEEELRESSQELERVSFKSDSDIESFIEEMHRRGNRATVQLCNRATVQPCNCVTVQLYYPATVLPCNCATVLPCYCATVQLYNRATVQLCYRATVLLCNRATVQSCYRATAAVPLRNFECPGHTDDPTAWVVGRHHVHIIVSTGSASM